MKKVFLTLSILVTLVLPNVSFAAVAFDSVHNAEPASASSPLEFTFNNVGGDYVTFGFTMLTKGTPGTVTANGKTMVLITQNTSDSNENVYLYGVESPGTGNITMHVDWSGTHTTAGSAYSMNGVAPSVQPDATSTASTAAATSLTNTVNTVADGSWVVEFERSPSGNPVSAGTNTVRRQTYSSPSMGFFEPSVNPITPAGAGTMNVNNTSSGRMIAVGASFSPVATPSVSKPVLQIIWW